MATSNDRFVLERYDKSSNTWRYVDDVNLNGAGKTCRTTSKKTGISHRVRNVTTGKLIYEC